MCDTQSGSKSLSSNNVKTFTATTRQSTNTSSTHSHPLRISLKRKKFHSDIFFHELSLCETNSLEDACPANTNKTSLSIVSIVMYSTYPNNLHFLSTAFTLVQAPNLVILSSNWILFLMNKSI